MPSVESFSVTSTLRVSQKAVVKDPKHVISALSSGDAVIVDDLARAAVPLGSIASVNFGKQLRDRSKYKKDVVSVDSRRAVPAGYAACYTGSDVGAYKV